MQLLDDHIIELYRQGKISEADAIDHSHVPSEIREKIEAHRGGRLPPAGTDNDKNNT